MSTKNKTRVKSLRLIQIFLVSFLFLFVFVSIYTFNNDSNALSYKNFTKLIINKRPLVPNIVYAKVETEPVHSVKLNDDAADDAAIWKNFESPDKSIIFCTNKKQGIHSYNLKGKEIQFIKYAKINNTDIRQNVKFGSNTLDFLAATNNSNETIDFFIINDEGIIESKPNYSYPITDFEPHGFSLHLDKSDNLYAIVNSKKGGDIHQYLIAQNKLGFIKTNLVRSYKINGRIEGMVVDDESEKLYVSEEKTGIHVFNTNLKKDTIGFILSGSTSNKELKAFDIEGLALVSPEYLIASYQGNSTFSVFNTKNNSYVTSFVVKDSKTIDGVEETDGIDVHKGYLGENFSSGIFVVHDGFNFDDKKHKRQNFKYVELSDVLDLLP